MEHSFEHFGLKTELKLKLRSPEEKDFTQMVTVPKIFFLCNK